VLEDPDGPHDVVRKGGRVMGPPSRHVGLMVPYFGLLYAYRNLVVLFDLAIFEVLKILER
jgi:hypothetical protein